MSYFYSNDIAKRHDGGPKGRLEEAIDRRNKKMAKQESKPAAFRGRRTHDVLFSVHIPTVRRRREARNIRRDIFRDNSTNIGNATEFNATMRSASRMTF